MSELSFTLNESITLGLVNLYPTFILDGNNVNFTLSDYSSIYNEVNWIYDNQTQILTNKDLSETFSLTDNILYSMIKTFLEEISLADENVVAKYIYEVFSEVMSLSDSIYKTSLKYISDSIILEDYIKRYINTIRLETINISENIFKLKVTYFNENISLEDIIKIPVLKLKLLGETIEIVEDTLNKSINKMLTQEIIISTSFSTYWSHLYEDYIRTVKFIKRNATALMKRL